MTSRRRTAAFLQAIVDGSPHAHIAISPQGEILFWNHGAQELFGYPCGEAVHRHFTEVVVAAERMAEAQKGVIDVLRDGQTTYETLARRKDGSLINVEVSLKVTRGTPDAPEFIAVTARDITRRTEVERALRASEERYRRIVETAAEGIWTLSADERIDYVNRLGAGILGCTPDQVLGRHPSAFICQGDIRADIDSTDLWKRGLHEGADFRIRRGDGTDAWVRMAITTITGPGNTYLGALAMFTDISAQKRAHDAIRKLSSIVQFSDDAIISETLEGSILSWNAGATRIFGYSPDEVIGKSITILVPPQYSSEPFDILDRIKRGERVEHYSTIRRRKDGTFIDVSQSMSPIRDAADNITGVSIIARDITEERKLREQLDDSVRRRAEDLIRFVTALQHAQEEERQRISRELHDDLGQLLTGVKMRVELIEEDLPDVTVAVARKLVYLKQEIDRLIVEVRRISANLRPAALDDFGLVVALQLLCREVQKASNITVAFEAGANRECDKDIEIALYRIAQEALSNMVRHARATTASVRLTQDRSVIGIMIEDNGRGFDMSDAQNGKRGAHGLGLISMKERAQLFGGSLYVTSAPGRGTRIHVEVPIAREDGHEADTNTHR